MKLLSAIVLLLWTVCFLHCSAEQFGILDCGQCSTTCPQDCQSEPCPGSENDREAPCGICDFLALGGVPTTSAFVLESFTDSGIDTDFAGVLTSDHSLQPEANLCRNAVGV
jgi:hypothetical protein